MSLLHLYDPDICDGHACPKDCDSCSPWAELVREKQAVELESSGIYDQEEIHRNCTVQILRNSVTGETSIGWWEEGSG